ncbi:hypothetical protein U1Q18_009399, partial [Sarracenia purpurea var. burkii]
DEIERLKSDKESLLLELERHKQEQLGIDLQTQVLIECCHIMEQRHRNILSSLARTMQIPALALDFVAHSEKNHERKRRLPRNNCLFNEESSEDNHMGPSQEVSGENLKANNVLVSSQELIKQLDSSLMFLENVIHELGQAFLLQNASVGLDESTSCADSPAISYTQIDIDFGSKISGIDMNSEPAASVIPASEEQVARPAASLPNGVNDVFWEQFLTENPGSSNALEVQSERKDLGRKNESDFVKFWWNTRNVNYLAENMGQLAPAEGT